MSLKCLLVGGLALALTGACGSDDPAGTPGNEAGSPGKEAGVTIPDSAPNTEPDAGVTTPDTAVPTPDSGPTPDSAPVDNTGFGDVCDQTTPCVNPAMQCVGLQGGDPNKGFCTKQCTTAGQPCDGAPTDTEARCVISNEDQTFLGCGFVCKVVPSQGQEQTFNCPSSLKCGPGNTQQGTTVHLCVP